MKGVANEARQVWEQINVGLPAQCWHFQQRPNSRGYGRFCVSGKRWLAHRLVYTLTHGNIPDSLVVDHECHNRDASCPGGLCHHRLCCNPFHLQLATSVKNIKNSPNSPGNQTHCRWGHEYTRENTYIRPDGAGRQCRQCIKIRSKRQVITRREARKK